MYTYLIFIKFLYMYVSVFDIGTVPTSMQHKCCDSVNKVSDSSLDPAAPIRLQVSTFVEFASARCRDFVSVSHANHCSLLNSGKA